MKTLYDILGVASCASDAELKAAYRRAAMKWHPDRNRGRERQVQAEFQRVKEAYAALNDPVRRAAYDVSLADDRRRAQNDGPHFGSWQHAMPGGQRVRREFAAGAPHLSASVRRRPLRWRPMILCGTALLFVGALLFDALTDTPMPAPLAPEHHDEARRYGRFDPAVSRMPADVELSGGDAATSEISASLAEWKYDRHGAAARRAKADDAANADAATRRARPTDASSTGKKPADRISERNETMPAGAKTADATNTAAKTARAAARQANPAPFGSTASSVAAASVLGDSDDTELKDADERVSDAWEGSTDSVSDTWEGRTDSVLGSSDENRRSNAVGPSGPSFIPGVSGVAGANGAEDPAYGAARADTPSRTSNQGVGNAHTEQVFGDRFGIVLTQMGTTLASTARALASAPLEPDGSAVAPAGSSSPGSDAAAFQPVGATMNLSPTAAPLESPPITATLGGDASASGMASAATPTPTAPPTTFSADLIAAAASGTMAARRAVETPEASAAQAPNRPIRSKRTSAPATRTRLASASAHVKSAANNAPHKSASAATTAHASLSALPRASTAPQYVARPAKPERAPAARRQAGPRTDARSPAHTGGATPPTRSASRDSTGNGT